MFANGHTRGQAVLRSEKIPEEDQIKDSNNSKTDTEAYKTFSTPNAAKDRCQAR